MSFETGTVVDRQLIHQQQQQQQQQQMFGGGAAAAAASAAAGCFAGSALLSSGTSSPWDSQSQLVVTATKTKWDVVEITFVSNKKTAYFTLFALVVLAGSAGCALGGFDPEKVAKYFMIAGGVAAGLGVIRLSCEAYRIHELLSQSFRVAPWFATTGRGQAAALVDDNQSW